MHLWCLKDLQTLFQDFPIIMPRNKNNNIKTYYLHLPEVFVNFTFHTMCSKSKWDKALILVVGVVLVQGIIQTFVQLVKIEQNNCPACFHADLDAIDIPTYLFWERHFQRYIIYDCQNYKIITLSANVHFCFRDFHQSTPFFRIHLSLEKIIWLRYKDHIPSLSVSRKRETWTTTMNWYPYYLVEK